jgi:hypothetical protein
LIGSEWTVDDGLVGNFLVIWDHPGDEHGGH